jgi:AcrR family transcriptional regulator
LRGVETGARREGRPRPSSAEAPGVPARAREEGDPSRRSRILGAAGQLFAGTPYDEVSIDDIAGRAGVAKGLLYYYFGSKRGLFIELMREIVDGLTRIAGDGTAVDPLVRLRRTLDAYLALAAAAPEAFRQVSSGELGPEVQAIRNREKDELIAQISEVVTESRVAGPILRAALEGWIGMVEGMTLHWSRERSLEAAEVRTLLLAALPGVLSAAQALDPALDVDTRRLGKEVAE